MGFWGIPVSIATAATNPHDSVVSTIDTIHQMIAIAKVSSHSPKIASVIDNLVRTLPRHSTQQDLVRAIYWWIKNHVTYEEDESILANRMGYQDPNQELLIAPDTLLSMQHPMGDCDDFSLLAASFMLAAKIP